MWFALGIVLGLVIGIFAGMKLAAAFEADDAIQRKITGADRSH